MIPRRRLAKRWLAVEGMKLVARGYGIEVAVLMTGRTWEIAFARQIAIHLAVKVAELSYEEAGELFSRHRQTVWMATKRVRDAVAVSSEAARVVARYEAALEAKKAKRRG